MYKNSLFEPLIALAQQDPDRILLDAGDEQVSAGQLFGSVCQLAAGLTASGFKEGDIAIIITKPGVEFVTILYALMMLNGRVAIIDPEMGSANFRAKITQLKPRWAFIDSRLLFLREHFIIRYFVRRRYLLLPSIDYSSIGNIISVGGWMPMLKQYKSFGKMKQYPVTGQPELISADEAHEYMLVYTSGTLQEPKGVMHSYRTLQASIQQLAGILVKNKDLTLATNLPHFMLLGIACNIRVKLMPLMTAAQKLVWIAANDINLLFGPPSDYLQLIDACLQQQQMLPDSLRQVIIGSAPVHKSFLVRLIAVLPLHTRITCTYGMTENLLVATVDGREKITYPYEGDVVGATVPGVKVQVADDGELMIRSEQLFCRYFHETAQPDWHYTGDLGKLDADGNIVLTAEKKEMILRGNFNIYPALYEDTIKSIPGVEEAAMVGVYSNELEDEMVYLAIEGHDITPAFVEKQLRSAKYGIDAAALPDKIVVITIPRKGRQQKIDRNAIVTQIKDNGL